MKWMLVTMVTVVLLGGSCSSTNNAGSGAPPTTTTSVPGGPTIVMTSGTTFQPGDVTVSPGATVRWVNGDGIPHTVTSGAGSTSSGAGSMFDHPLAAGTTFDFTFSTAGTYPYFCRIHEAMNMRGTITVTGATSSVDAGAGGSGGTGGSGGSGGTGGSAGTGGTYP